MFINVKVRRSNKVNRPKHGQGMGRLIAQLIYLLAQ